MLENMSFITKTMFEWREIQISQLLTAHHVIKVINTYHFRIRRKIIPTIRISPYSPVILKRWTHIVFNRNH